MTGNTRPPTLEEALSQAVAEKRPEEADRLREAIAENRKIADALDRMDYSTADALLDAKRTRLANDRDR